MSVFNIESKEQFIEEVFPEGRPTELKSKELFKENVLDWSVAMKRNLKAGIRNADEDVVKSVLREYAYFMGRESAVEIYLRIWGDLVEENMEDDQDETL